VKQPTAFVVTPSLESSKVELRGTEVWMVKQDDPTIAVRCFVNCWIKHPDFAP
jgi:hypothetical protein